MATGPASGAGENNSKSVTTPGTASHDTPQSFRKSRAGLSFLPHTAQACLQYGYQRQAKKQTQSSSSLTLQFLRTEALAAFCPTASGPSSPACRPALIYLQAAQHLPPSAAFPFLPLARRGRAGPLQPAEAWAGAGPGSGGSPQPQRPRSPGLSPPAAGTHGHGQTAAPPRHPPAQLPVGVAEHRGGPSPGSPRQEEAEERRQQQGEAGQRHGLGSAPRSARRGPADAAPARQAAPHVTAART